MPKTNPKPAASEEQLSEVDGTPQKTTPARAPRKKAASSAAKAPARKGTKSQTTAKGAAKKSAASTAKTGMSPKDPEAAPARRTRKAASAPKAEDAAADLSVPPSAEASEDMQSPAQPEATAPAEAPAEAQATETGAQAPAEVQPKPKRTARRKATEDADSARAKAPAAAKKATSGRSSRRKAARAETDEATDQNAVAAQDTPAAESLPADAPELAEVVPAKRAARRPRQGRSQSPLAAPDENAEATAPDSDAQAAAPTAELPAKPKRTSRRTTRRKPAEPDSAEASTETAVVSEKDRAGDSEALPSQAVTTQAVTTEPQEPLADLPAAQAEAASESADAGESAEVNAPDHGNTAPQETETKAAPRKTRQSRSKRRQAADRGVPAPAESAATEAAAPVAGELVAGEELTPASSPEAEAAAEPLVLQRPRRGKRKASPSEEPLDTDLEKLSGVEPVSAQGDRDGNVLATLLPDLPLTAEAPAPVAGPEGLDDPVQDLLVSQLRTIGRPIHVRDLEKSFTRQKARLVGSWRDIEGVLEELARAGLVVRTRKKTYGLPDAMNLVRGRFQASNAGFGFVVPDSGREDYYVPPESTLEAWNGDTVLVRPEGHGPRGSNSGRRGGRFDGNPQASVVRIVQRHSSQLVGTLEYSHGYPILKADDFRARHRILLLSEGIEDLTAGARVVVDLYWPEDTGEDEVFGQVSRVLGEEDDPETETEAVMVKYGLRGEFPQEVLSEAGRIPAEIPESALRDRMDLRHLNTFTVDGRDAKDFDDAIHIQPTERGTFLVGVHIADVSHYVKAGSELDGEAYARATSVYLPGRVLPMLPEHLSNGVCSLVPYEDRLTMSALVELSADAEILNVDIGPSVIHSKARLTYDEVQAYSEGTSPMPEHARHLEGDLHLLLKVTTKLRQQRLRGGSLDFKMREVKVDVDEEGRMELIPLREETARGMIEDLMLLANKVVAHFLLERNVPTLFRIHEEPTLQRFQDVSQAIGRLGLAFPGGEPTPQAYQDVLKQVRGTPRESVVNTLLLRSMQQAKYAGENLGHFGLAFDEYLHFTSPIRRYPDLMVHRVLRGVLSGELRPGSREVDQLRSVLPSMGEHTSDRERNAAEAERDLTKYYQAKWAQEHQGLSFMGSVSGVVASGLFVALDNGVEGKLHISNLDDDYYIYLEDAQMLKGRSTGKTFKLGDAVPVTISDVKPLARQIDFTMPEDGTELEEIVMSENQPSGNKTQGSGQKVGGQKVRARRREDREQERQQKLSNVRPSQPRFTLEEDTAGRSQGQSAQGGRSRGPRSGGEGRSSESRGPQPQNGRSGRDDRTRGAYAPQSGGRRRVITLERPRNEHLRPVNITVQRMYFGDWTVDNLPEDEGNQGGRPGRGGGLRSSRMGSREGRAPQGRGRSEPGSHVSAAQPQGQGSGSEGDRRRRRRRSRRPAGESNQS